MQKGSSNHNFYLVKSVFEALFDFKAAKTLRKCKAVTFRKKNSIQKLDICFGALFENAAVKKDFKKKAAVVKAKIDRRQCTDLWATWRKVAAPRFARYEALKNSVGCSKRYLARHALLEWREFVEYVQRMETLVANYSIEKARAKGVDCLQALKAYAHNSSLRRHRNQSIYNFAETKQTYKVFAAFVQSISEIKSRRHNTGRALDF